MFLSFLFILLFNLTNIKAGSTISLPFIYINNKTNTSTPITDTPKDYFESLMKNPLYTTIKVNNKDIKIHITLDRYTTYISQKTLLEIDPEAAEIKEDEDLYSLEYIGIYRAKYTNSSFLFKLNDTQDITLSNYSFFMVKEMMNEYDYAIRTRYLATENEEIGFNVLKGNKIEKVEVEEDDEDYDPYYPYYQYNPYVKEEEKIDYLNNKNNDERKVGEKYVNKNNGYLVEENTNIITQLKKQKIISSYTFCIKYDNKNEEKGKIIIGECLMNMTQDIFQKDILYIILLLWVMDMEIGELILMILNIMEKVCLM